MRDPSNVFKDAVDELFQGYGRKNPRRIFFAPVFPYAEDNLGMECEKIGRWRLMNACNMSFHHREYYATNFMIWDTCFLGDPISDPQWENTTAYLVFFPHFF